MPALRHQEGRDGLPDDLACRDATRGCVSTQTARPRLSGILSVIVTEFSAANGGAPARASSR